MKMTLLTTEAFESLAKVEGRTCLTIYLPTVKAGHATAQNPIRLKNLLGEAETQLAGMGMEAKSIRSFLKPLTTLRSDVKFWQHQDHGLALFRHEDFLGCFPIPYSVPEIALAANAFHFKPLWRLVADEHLLYILALSQNEVRLFESSQFSIRRVDIDGVPASIDEALKYDDPEKSLHVHPGAPGGRGEQTAIVHGHGGKKDKDKDRLLRYFRQVDKGLRSVMQDRDAPLLLAGVEYYLPLYREATSHDHCLSDMITGNPEHLSPGELRRVAWALAEPYFDCERRKVAQSMQQALAKGKATTELDEAMAAAAHGRVAACFIDLNEYCWGTFDDSNASVNRLSKSSPCANDLIDRVAVNTWLHHGQVFPVGTRETVPGKSSVAALMRY